MANNLNTILTLGAVGVGGYLFVTQVWPMLKRQLSDAFEPEEEEYIPRTIIEDRTPDYYPVSVPQPYPVPVAQPYPVFQSCPPGKFWDGYRCKNIDIDCPPGYREDDGVCKPRNCDRDEIFDGRRCIKIPRPRCDRDEFWNGRRCERIPRCDRDEHWNGHRCEKCGRNEFWNGNRCQTRVPDRDRPTWPDRDDSNNTDRDDRTKKGKKQLNKKPPENRWGNTRDRWNADRETEERMKPKPEPEKDRVKEIAEKAVTNFIEMWEY